MITVSYLLLNHYSVLKEHKLCAHPYMEIYDGNTIYFMAPLARQNEFYVPEVQEDEERADDGDDEDDDSSVDESVSGEFNGSCTSFQLQSTLMIWQNKWLKISLDFL